MKDDQLTTVLNTLKKTKSLNVKRLNKIKRHHANTEHTGMIKNAELLAVYKKQIKAGTTTRHLKLENLLKKRAIRTLSGVAPIAVLTKPYPCPGRCAFCPNEPDMPKSYLSNEPAVMRAIGQKFDPRKQVLTRLRALEEHGHTTDKVELIVMGGTFSYLPKNYQTRFIKSCFDACNGRSSQSLAAAQKINETAKYRIVGLTLETRPDYIDKKEIERFRQLGCTKVEIGIQAIDDKILKLNKRGTTVAQIIRATTLLKQAGFKVAYHMMPNLPGATTKKDLQMYQQLFTTPDFQPDMIKIYPCVVTRDTLIYKWWRAGKFRPYSDKNLVNLITRMKAATPDYVRIIRLIRDIPAESIIAGNKISNLRQLLQEQMKKNGTKCHCIRCREARENIKNINQAKLFIEKYRASGGTEYFLQYASPRKDKLYAFLRLRFNDEKNHFISELREATLIREVHTYGQLMSLREATTAIQHIGLGKKLVATAEELARQHGKSKIAVISGVGVRGYYRKLGYRLRGTYMLKNLK